MGVRFPLGVHQKKSGLLAQLVEQSPLKRSVVGSNPTQPTLAAVLELVDKHGLGPCGAIRGGSNPLCGTYFLLN